MFAPVAAGFQSLLPPAPPEDTMDRISSGEPEEAAANPFPSHH